MNQNLSQQRDPTLDIFRGIIICLMALDHSLAFVGKIVPASEVWGIPLPAYSSLGEFFPRWISHLCAPGFTFLVGVGMVLFMHSRNNAGWDSKQIRKFLITRGIFLIVLQHFIYNLAWFIFLKGFSIPSSPFPGNGGIPFAAFSILSALGFSMIFWSFFQKVRSRFILALSITTFIATQLIILSSNVDTLYSPLLRLLFIPGQTGIWLVRSPFIPWLGIAGLGIAWGRVYTINREKAYQTALVTGTSLLAIFLLIRIANGFGNFHFVEKNLISFIHVTKFPPSLAFISLTMGINFLILFSFSKVRTRLLSPFAIVGSSPLFFYLTHIYLYLLMGILYPDGTSFYRVLPFWLLGIVMLAPACKRFGEFKRSKPVNSLWRCL